MSPRTCDVRILMAAACVVCAVVVPDAHRPSGDPQQWRGGWSSSAGADADRAMTRAIDRLERDGVFAPAIDSARVQLRWREAVGLREAQAASLDRLGEMERRDGRYVDAIAHLERALELRRDLGQRHGLDFASTLVRLGRAEKDRGLYDAAERHFRQARAIAHRAGAAGANVEARALMGCANSIRRKTAERPRAIRLLEEALRRAQGRRDPDPVLIAEIRADLALVLLQVGNAARAAELSREALAVQRDSLGTSHPDVALTMSLCGWSALMAGAPAQAEPAFEGVLRIYATLRDRSSPGFHRLRYRATIATALAAARLAQGRELDAWDALDRGLSTLQAVTMASSSGTNAWDGETATQRLARVQAQLSPGTVMIGWMDAALGNAPPFQSWAFVVPSRGPVRWIRTPLLPDVEAAGTQLPRAEHLVGDLLRDSTWPTRLPDGPRLRALRHRLWEERIRPIEPLIAGARALIVVDSDALSRIPVEALLDATGAAMADRFTISYVSSASTLSELRTRAASRRPAPGDAVVLIGAPTSSAGEVEAGTASRGGPIAHASEFAVLEGAAAEIAAIRRCYPGAMTMEGDEARESLLHARTHMFERANVVHVASHAVGDTRFPDASALALAEAETSALRSGGDYPTRRADHATGADGWWRREEIERLRLSADLVTLSGCMTAGYHDFGGYVGLCDAFLTAGASTVVMSLWPVDDRVTSLLMGRFYRELKASKGTGAPATAGAGHKAAALHRAKRWLRDFQDERGRRPYLHPAYWAGFILWGDPGSSITDNPGRIASTPTRHAQAAAVPAGR